MEPDQSQDGMAKAQITTPSGINIKVEGTPTEILAVVQDLERKYEKAVVTSKRNQGTRTSSGRLTLAGLFHSFRDEGFFNQPRDLGSIRSELEAKGHFYPVTSLSGAALREVQKRNLRRLKKDGRWFYVRSG